MSGWEMTFWIGLSLVNVVMMGIYSGSELGLYVMNKVRLELRASRGEASAKRLHRRLQRPNHLLAVLLIGTNIHGYLATFAISTLLLRLGFAHRAEWMTILVMTPVLFVFADALPKTIFRKFAERLVYRLSPLVVFADYLFTFTGLSILVRSFGELMLKLAHRKPASVENEFRQSPLALALDEGHAAGALTLMQTQMAERVLHLRDVRLGNVMTPRKHVTGIDAAASDDELRAAIAACDHSRLPVLAGGDVVGMVDVYDVLTDPAGGGLDAWQTSPLRLSASMPVADAMCTLQRTRHSMAVVVKDDTKYLGIVTVKDIVEEIVGELQEW